MTEVLYGFDNDVALWVSERIPDVIEFKDFKALGVVSNDRLIAGVVYSDFQPIHKTIQLSIAADSPMWAKREIITELLSYPFDQLGVWKCWITTPSDNEASLKMSDHVGFKREAVLSNQFGKKRHAIISRMFKPDFKRLYKREAIA